MNFIDRIPIIILFNGFFLRELYVSDSVALFPTFNDEENHRFTSFEPHLSVEQTAQWIERVIKNRTIWAIASPDSIAIGFVGYHSINDENKSSMIAYHLNKEFWGRGIGPASIDLTDRYIFDNTDFTKISATVKPENIQSQRCLEKAGYSLEKIIDNYVSSAVNDHSRIRYYYSKYTHIV